MQICNITKKERKSKNVHRIENKTSSAGGDNDDIHSFSSDPISTGGLRSRERLTTTLRACSSWSLFNAFHPTGPDSLDRENGNPVGIIVIEEDTGFIGDEEEEA
jgi:hypothetical protein